MILKPFCLTAAFAMMLGAAPLARAETLTLYSAQHEQVVDMLTAAFTKETGIKVLVHEGEGPDIAAQILQEGADSPADVFFTENSPELNLLDEKGLLAPVDKATLARGAGAIQRGRWRLAGRAGAGECAGLQPVDDQGIARCRPRCWIWRSRNGRASWASRRAMRIFCRW